MISWLRQMRAYLKNRSNYALADSCGSGSYLSGSIEKRAIGSQLTIGEGCLMQGILVLERSESQIYLGNQVLVGGQTIIDCALSVTIEDGVLISYQCIISDSDNHSLYPELRSSDLANWMDGRRHDWRNSAMAPVRIRRNAWVGARSIILKGVTIGEEAVIGMGSVVTRDVPPRTVVAGNPAKVIKEIGLPPL